MIIETSDNRLYAVRPAQDPALDHVWLGIEMKEIRRGEYVMTAAASRDYYAGKPLKMVRKAATRVVQP